MTTTIPQPPPAFEVDLSKPVIWTKYGNVNTDLLEESAHWEFGKDNIVVGVEWRLKTTNELVKRSVHIWHEGLKPLEASINR